MLVNIDKTIENEEQKIVKMKRIRDFASKQITSIMEKAPDSFSVSMNSEPSLVFVDYSTNGDNGNSMSDFIAVVKLVEKHFNVKLKKETTEPYDGAMYLDAEGFFKNEAADITFDILVRQCNTKSCVVEYKEETIKKPVLTGNCKDYMEL